MQAARNTKSSTPAGRATTPLSTATGSPSTTEGHIYTVEPDGFLHWRAYDATTGAWTHRVIADGWSQFNLIVAAGRGVIYARAVNGNFYRYRYHAASQRWLVVGRQVGHTWQIYGRVFSAGADILYAVQPDGKMYWYRWDENTQAWVSNVGKLVGAPAGTTGPPPRGRTPAG